MTRLETRSLPGANMATQTETHAGTQTPGSCLRARAGSDCGQGGVSRRSRGYGDRDCSRSANYPRRSFSTPRRHMFNSPIMEETGSGSGASSGPRSANGPTAASGDGPRSSVDGPPGVPLSTVSGGAGRRRQQFAALSSTSSSAGAAGPDGRRSRSYSNLRELDLDRQLQYMTPSLRSRALARRRLSTSLPARGGRGRPPPRVMQMLEKKSVFTIAYGDVATQKINCSADSSSNNWD